MNQEVLFFFEKMPDAVPLYEALEEHILSEIEKAKSPSSKSKKCFPIRISPYLKYL